jgi:hypothetical protein
MEKDVEDGNEVKEDYMDLDGIDLQNIIEACQRWDIISIPDDRTL